MPTERLGDLSGGGRECTEKDGAGAGADESGGGQTVAAGLAILACVGYGFSLAVHSMAGEAASFVVLLAAACVAAVELRRVRARAAEREGEWERRVIELERILDCTKDALLLLDADLIVRRLNKAAEALLGTTAAEVIGKPCPGLFCGGRIGEDLCPSRRALRQMESRSVESVDPVTGREYGLWAFPFPDAAGRPAGVVHVMYDLTEKRRLHTEIRLRERLAVLGRMGASIAHDLNNPLASIMGYAQLLEPRLAGDEKLRKWVGVIRESAERARDIVADLLTFARPPERNRKPVNVGSLVSGLREQFQPRLDAAGVELAIEKSPFTVETLGDETQVVKVLSNLLGNAIDAVEQVPRKVIHIHYGIALDQAILSISDSGPGIAPENLEKVFEPFFTTKKGGKGTGLGLATCRSLVEVNGGRITVKNNPDGGCRFTVFLPSTHNVSSAVIDMATLGGEVCARLGVENALVVLPEGETQERIVRVLRACRVGVESVSEVAVARSLLDSFSFDIVFVGQSVGSDGDGLLFAREIVARQAGLRGRVTVVAAGAETPAPRADEGWRSMAAPTTPQLLVSHLLEMLGGEAE